MFQETNISVIQAQRSSTLFDIGSFLATAALPTGDVLTAGEFRDAYVLKLSRAKGITVSPTAGLVTTEDGGTATFSVELDLLPTADVTAQDGVGVVGNQLAQRESGGRAVEDDALIVAMINNLPALGVVVALGERLVQQRFQPSAAPKVAAKQRLEP